VSNLVGISHRYSLVIRRQGISQFRIIHKSSPPLRVYRAFLVGLAQIEAHTGQSEQAVKLLRQLLTMPAGEYISVARLKIDPVWDSIRNDPGFQNSSQRLRKRFFAARTLADQCH
jgi:hypothetical protein